MANLIIQDTFEPYYAGRDDGAKRQDERREISPRTENVHGGQIVLPTEAPTPVRVRNDRRAVAH